MTKNIARRFSEWSKSDRAVCQLALSLADVLVNQVYFASGAVPSESEPVAASPLQVSRFFAESGPLLEKLCNLPFVNAAHSLLETLKFFIPQDPERVLCLVHRVILSARRDHIQYEFMSADLTVSIIEQLLADHRFLFGKGTPSLPKLLDLLDLFVDAGWPRATRLVFRMDVFR